MLPQVPVQQENSPPVNDPTRKLAIKSRNVMLEEYNEPVEAIILIEDEQIVDTILISQENKLFHLENLSETWEIIDYGDLYIFPGIVDSNVYLHADFGPEWENVTYSTELAAAGGVTTIIDNPIMTKPFSSGEEYVESLKQRIAIIRENSKVDFGVYGVLEPKTEGYIDEMLEVGALGLKCFIMSAFQNTVDYYEPETLKKVIEVLGERHPGLLLLIHPEMATERELYLTSPCRTFSLETRMDKYHIIKSIEFGGGANKGAYVDELAKKNDSDDEEECPTAKLDSPSKLKGKIKKIQEKMQSEDIAISELESYKFKSQFSCNLDEIPPELDTEVLGKRIKIRSHTCPADAQGLQDTDSRLQEEEKVQEDNENLMENQDQNEEENVSPFKKSYEEEEKCSQYRACEAKNGWGKRKGSLEGILAGIPEEADKEESRSTLRKIISDSQPQDFDSRTISLRECYESSRPDTHEKIDTWQEIRPLEHKKSVDEIGREEKFMSGKKYGGRQRYSAIDEEEDNYGTKEEVSPVQQPEQKTCSLINLIPTQNINPFGSESSLKEERSTLDSFDACLKNGPTNENNEVVTNQSLNANRKFLSLVTDSDSKKSDTRNLALSENKSTLESENNNEDSDGSKNIRIASLDINMSPEQTPMGIEGSPQNFDLESPNMSPTMLNKASSMPFGSSLLLRRLSRKSSCNIGGSNNSVMSSPTMNRLDLSAASKGSCLTKEADANQNYRIFLANRPQSWEENAVSLILAAIKPETKLRVILQNLSLASSLFKIRQKQKSGAEMAGRVVSDTCPSYLYFTEKMVKKGETKYKVSPPFRNQENKHILLETLRLGGVDMMGSYHFYVPPRFKLIDEGNFRRAVGGLDSLGCSLQAAWTASLEYHQQKNSRKYSEDLDFKRKSSNEILRRIYKAMCANPAKALNISKRKGAIAKGRDADLVIWDPYSGETFNQLGPNHVFAGKELMGKVHKTYLRGNLIYDRDEPEKVERNYKSNFIKC